MPGKTTLSGVLAFTALSSALTFSVPQTVPGRASAQLAAAPVGASYVPLASQL